MVKDRPSCFFSKAETCASVSTSPSHTELYSRQRFWNDSGRSIHKMTTFRPQYSVDDRFQVAIFTK